MNYSLPKTVIIGEQELGIRYDFRVILEIITMLQDADLEQGDKAQALLQMFYMEPEKITDANTAIKECFRFIDMGDKPEKKAPKTMDWEQDFEYIIAPINRVLGYEARAVEYNPETNQGGLHWWTFMSAYMEIGGDCLFSQIVSIRDKQARGKKLEKYEREWMNRNKDLIILKNKYSEAEDELLTEWIGGANG